MDQFLMEKYLSTSMKSIIQSIIVRRFLLVLTWIFLWHSNNNNWAKSLTHLSSVFHYASTVNFFPTHQTLIKAFASWLPWCFFTCEQWMFLRNYMTLILICILIQFIIIIKTSLDWFLFVFLFRLLTKYKGKKIII